VYDDEDIVDEEEASKRPPDPAVLLAIPRLRAFFDSEPQRLFYSTQIETSLERDFFHWITGRALLELGNAGDVQRVAAHVQGQIVNFYAHRRHRYIQRELRAMRELIERMFHPEFTHAIGRHGELMFDAALGRNAFRAEAQDTNSWNGKTWTDTNHNLDRIVTRDGIAYGVEIKNTQNYIPRQELKTKLQMCRYLDLTPLLIMRFAPKSYMHEIQQAGGFALLFEEQTYPFGHAELLAEVRQRLGLKVQSPRDVKTGDMERLLKWHIRQVKRT